MKKEKIIIISLASLLVFVTIFIFVKNYITYRKISIITQNPFNTIEVLGNKIRLKDNIKTYKEEIDCGEVTTNEQLLYYRLNSDYKEFKVSVTSFAFQDDKLITEDFNTATSFDFNISVFDKDKEYEQVYHISATCQNNQTDEETDSDEAKTNDEDKSTSDNNNSSKSKSTKKNKS